MRFSSQKGEGKVGCLLFLLLLACFVFLSVRTVPVYLDKMDFEESMARIASQAGVDNWPDAVIVERVRASARANGFEVKLEDIKVVRAQKYTPVPEIRIEVDYRRPVALPGYTHMFSFQSRVSSFVGRL